jgi:hypothetical protein
MVEELMRQFPYLDRMMAETLVWAYENGALQEEGEKPEKPEAEK